MAWRGGACGTWRDLAWHGVARPQRGVAWHMAWRGSGHGVAWGGTWQGVARHGVAWHGMAW
eukprot:3607307-Prymnesium_polylepis.1